MLRELIEVIRSRREARIVLIALFVLVIVLIVLAVVFNSGLQLRGTRTNFTFDNTVTMDQDKLRGFNGISFYEIDPSSNNDPRILHTPTERLPDVSQIAWASDKGALLNFESGFNYTPAERYMDENGISRFSDILPTWYIDFKSGELRAITKTEIDLSRVAYINETGSFYISQSDADGESFSTYDIDSTRLTEITKSPDITNISFIARCGNTVCFDASSFDQNTGETSSSALYKLENETIKKIREADIVRPFNDGHSFALLSGAEDPGTDIIVQYKELRIVDGDNEESAVRESQYNPESLGLGVAGSIPYVTNQEAGKFSDFGFFGNRQKSIRSDTGSFTTDGLIPLPNRNANNASFSLVSSYKREFFVLGNGGVRYDFDANDTTAETKQLLDRCTKGKVVRIFTESDTNYELLIADNTSFNTRVKEINQCLAGSSRVLVNNMFRYVGVDETNGRVSTD